jgi:hypothetical protein
MCIHMLGAHLEFEVSFLKHNQLVRICKETDDHRDKRRLYNEES